MQPGDPCGSGGVPEPQIAARVWSPYTSREVVLIAQDEDVVDELLALLSLGPVGTWVVWAGKREGSEVKLLKNGERGVIAQRTCRRPCVARAKISLCYEKKCDGACGSVWAVQNKGPDENCQATRGEIWSQARKI